LAPAQHLLSASLPPQHIFGTYSPSQTKSIKKTFLGVNMCAFYFLKKKGFEKKQVESHRSQTCSSSKKIDRYFSVKSAHFNT
jgi:hypothetical protein